MGDTRPGRALDEGEERYQSVVKAMSEGVILQDAHATILACNEAAERLLGLTADQMMGRTSLDPRWRAIHEDGSPFPGDTHPVPVTLRTGQPQRDVVMGVHKPCGTLTWLSVNSEPIFRAGETTPYAAVCTFSDMTERKRAEDALRRSEERYRRIVDTTLEGVWIIDLGGKTQFANLRMAALLGCTFEELSASRVWDFIDDSDLALARQRIASRGRGIGEVHEFRLKRKDGSFLWTSMATTPITLADGTKGALAMVRDITAKRHMEAELRESKERLELALSAAQMGTWEMTIETEEVLVSREVRELFCLPPDAETVSPAAMLQRVHPDDLGELQKRMQAYAEAGSTGSFVVHYRVVRTNGEIRWVRSSGRPIVTPSGQHRVIGAILDVTDSHRLEEQLQKAQQLESIGRLAGGIAHDFNNLLTAILASVTFAETAKAPGIEDELHTIKTAAQRGAELTQQLLAFARKQVIRLAPVDLNASIRNVSGVLQRLVGEDITLTLELADDLWMLRGGESQLDQVLVNLVVNAREAMPDGGPLRIATQNVVVERATEGPNAGIRPGEYVTVTVTDAGIGIDPASLPHIFEPFYSTKRTGTGLGLASSYGIVQQLGGHIRVHSDVGVGTTFTVYFPRYHGLAQPKQPLPVFPAPQRSSSTILLVEDDDLLRRVIARGLADAGYHALVARDGEEAIAIAASHDGPIAVLVTDVIMPKMSGRQLAERFASLRPQTKTLFVSGYTDQIIARHGVLEPGQNFLPKPYTIEQLEHRIDELLGG